MDLFYSLWTLVCATFWVIIPLFFIAVCVFNWMGVFERLSSMIHDKIEIYVNRAKVIILKIRDLFLYISKNRVLVTAITVSVICIYTVLIVII